MNGKPNRIYKERCLNCPQFGSCTKLCDQAVAFVDQDYIGLHEIPHSPDIIDRVGLETRDIAWETGPVARMTKDEKMELWGRYRFTATQLKVIDLLFWQKKSQKEGSQKLGITPSRVSHIVMAIKKKLNFKKNRMD